MNPTLSTALAAFGGVLLLGGFVLLGACLISMTRAWRNGLPWWSGGPIWFNPKAQPPAARPHMRAALRRFGLSALCCFGAVALFALSET